MKILRAETILFLLMLMSMRNALYSEQTEQYKQVSCAVHVHSNYSGGKNQNLSEVVKKAIEKKIAVLVPTDHAIMKWEYGIFPLRNLLKASKSENSILKLGPKNYLEEIRKLQEQNPEILLIPGTETAAYYYWSGSPLKGDLKLNDWHKHMLLIGMDKETDYKNLPLLSNWNVGKFNFLAFWPVLLMLLAYAAPDKRVRIFLFAVSALILLNNYPFRITGYGQYSGSKGEKPYQALIDYAGSKGALVFWAHPDAPNWAKPVKVGPASIATKQYSQSLLENTGYDGFAVFSEGYKVTGAIGGPWDKALMEYCAGAREKPVWAIGELDYNGEYPKNMADIQNMLWVKTLDKSSVLNALKNGIFYVRWAKESWGVNLLDFNVKSGKRQWLYGRELPYDGKPRIVISLEASDAGQHPAKINIIKNGKLLNTMHVTLPGRFAFEDFSEIEDGKSYYRVFVDAGYPNYIITNPVFVDKK